MKSFLYKLFALIFNIGRLLPVRCARAVLLSPHPGEKYDSLSAVKEYLTNTGGFEICEISVPHKRTRLPEYLRFFIVAPVKLARAGYIFLNDNFMPLADLNLSRKTRVIQLWHGEGAFKKFGLLIEQSEEIKSRLIKCTGKTDYIICTSENVRGVYAEAFGARKDKVIALGSARNDYLINLDKAKT
ncbi:MAG: CDP-glycerol glycerophosphotransferase family protein, partial [Clostridia bacterium]|nr:CDP-glycerol glycerophosphotransferase family protein [Clostridia bacterium]